MKKWKPKIGDIVYLRYPENDRILFIEDGSALGFVEKGCISTTQRLTIFRIPTEQNSLNKLDIEVKTNDDRKFVFAAACFVKANDRPDWL